MRRSPWSALTLAPRSALLPASCKRLSWLAFAHLGVRSAMADDPRRESQRDARELNGRAAKPMSVKQFVLRRLDQGERDLKVLARQARIQFPSVRVGFSYIETGFEPSVPPQKIPPICATSERKAPLRAAPHGFGVLNRTTLFSTQIRPAMAAINPRSQSHHELWRVPFQRYILQHESTGRIAYGRREN